MIKLITGGIGSGKNLTAVKEIIKRKNDCFVNFPTFIDNTTRLKIEHIARKNVIGHKKNGEEKTQINVNWNFWESLRKKNKKFDIYIDEVHNVLNSRKSMSKWNTIAGIWLSQIRKIFGESESNHLYLISQKLSRVDIIARDLLYHIIFCTKKEYKKTLIPTKIIKNKREKTVKLPITYILNYHFIGIKCVEKFMFFNISNAKTYDFKTGFLANPYFKFYDTYELIKFGEDVYI